VVAVLEGRVGFRRVLVRNWRCWGDSEESARIFWARMVVSGSFGWKYLSSFPVS